jgi:hypothetical protein
MVIAEGLAKRIVSMKYEDLPPDAVRWSKISFVDTGQRRRIASGTPHRV